MTAFDGGVQEQPDEALPATGEAPKAEKRVDRKIDTMGKALGSVAAGAAGLTNCLAGIQDEPARVEIGRLADTARFTAAFLHTTLDSAASAGGDAESVVALARALEDIRAAGGQLMEQVDAADEIAGVVGDGLVSDLLHQIRDASEAFWHLLVLLLRQWALKGAIDIEFDD